MRHLLLTILLLGSLTSVAHAQMKEHYAERAQGADLLISQADSLTKQMTAQLQLSEVQIARVHKINTIKVAQMDVLQWQYHENPPRLQQGLAELQSQYEAECRRVLTPSQLSLLRMQEPAVPVPLSIPEDGLG